MKTGIYLIFLFVSIISLFATAAPVSNQGLVYQGRIVKSDGTPLNVGLAGFTISIYSDGDEHCLLYRETQNITMAGSNGVFSLVIGEGTRTDAYAGGTYTGVNETDINRIFMNAGTISAGANLTCDTGTTYTPLATAARKLEVSFFDGSQTVTLNPMSIKAVPFALQANEVGGYGSMNLAKISGAGSAVVLSPLEYGFLKFLAAPATALTNPCAAGNVLKATAGGAWTCASDDTGGGTSTSLTQVTLNSDTDNAGSDGGVNFQINGSNAAQITATGNFVVDTNTMVVDAANNRVGIGTATPGVPLDVNGAIRTTSSGTYAQIFANTYSDTNWHGSFLELFRARGTSALPTAVQSGDSLGYIDVWGYDGTAFVRASQISTEVDGAVAAGIVPSRIVFDTTNTAGVAGERMRIDNVGNVGIGTLTPTSLLHVNGDIQANGVLKLKTADAANQMIEHSVNDWGVQSVHFHSEYGFHISSNGTRNSPGFQGASGGLAIGTGGSERIRIDSSGNFGIGTTTPNTALDVNGTVSVRGLAVAPALSPADQGRIYFDTVADKFMVSQNGGAFTELITAAGASGSYWALGGNAPAATGVLGTTTNQDLSIITNNTAKVTILKTGEVGIGTAAPTETLHVAGGNVRFIDASNRTLLFGAGGIRSNSTLTAGSNTDGPGQINAINPDAPGRVVLYAKGVAAQTADLLQIQDSANAMKLNVTAAGNVGIGSSAPTSNLTIEAAANPSIELRRTAQSHWKFLHTNNGLAIQNSWTGAGYNSAITLDDGLGIGATPTLNLKYNGAGNRVGINNTAPANNFSVTGTADFSGNVGIGTTGPNTALDVNGAVSIRGLAVAPALSPADEGRIYFDTVADKFMVSQNAGAYSELVTSASAAGSYWALGGNAPAATGVLGTTTNQDLSIITNNTAKMTVLKTGEVGIGTGAPTSALHIIGSGVNAAQLNTIRLGPGGWDTPKAQNAALDGGVKIHLFDSGTQKLQIGMDSAAEMWFNNSGSANSGFAFYTAADTTTAPTAKMKITQAGNVGIGITGPTAKLHLVGSQTDKAILDFTTGTLPATSTGLNVYANTFASGGTPTVATFGFSDGAGSMRGGFTFNDIAGAGDWVTPRMDMSQSYGGAAEIRSLIEVENATWAGMKYTVQTKTNAALSTSPAFVWNNYTSELLRIASNGNVGIATTSPASKLHVGAAPTASANYGLVSLGNGPFDGTTATFFAGNAAGTVLAANTAAGYTGDLINFQIGGVTKFKVDSTGATTSSGNTVSTGNISTSGNIATTGTGTITSAGAMLASSGTASTSPTTGSLIVTGGAGISGALNVGSNIIANGNISTAASTAATAVANQNSPNIYLTANYWDGAATAIDQWSIQNILGAGTNPTSTLQFGHSGSTGATQYAFMNGNVGIGTASPGALLHLEKNQNAQSNQYFVNTSNGTGAAAVMYLSEETNPTTKAGIISRINSGFTPAGVLQPNSMMIDNLDNGGLWMGSRNAAGKIHFYTAGVAATNERMTIDNNGNVGIGTITPANHFEVADSATTATRGLMVSQYTSDAAAPVINLTKARGTQAAPLTVQNGDYLGSINTNVYGTGYVPGHAGIGFKVNGAVVGDTVPTDILFWSNTSGSANPYGDGSTKMVVTSAGNVGVGTTAPSTQLHVHNATNTGTSTDNTGLTVKSVNRSGYIGLDSAATGGSSVVFYNAGAEEGRILYTNSTDVLSVTAPKVQIVGSDPTNGAWSSDGQLTLQTSGSVFSGLGNHVSGISFGGVNNSPAANVYGQIRGVVDSTQHYAGGLSFWSHPDGLSTLSERMRITASGNVGVGTTSPTTSNGGVGRILEVNSTTNSTIVASTDGATNAGIFEARATAGVSAGDARLGQVSFVRQTDVTAGKVSSTASFWVNNDGTITNAMSITRTANVGIGIAAPPTRLAVEGARYLPGSNYDAIANFYSTDALGAGVGAGIMLGGNYTGSTKTAFAEISGVKYNATDNDYKGDLKLKVRDGASMITRMEIDYLGNVGFGITPSANYKMNILGTGTQDGILVQLPNSNNVFAAYADGGATLSHNMYTSGNNGLFAMHAGGTENVRLSSSGDSFFRGGNFQIGSIAPVWDEVLSVYKGNNDQVGIGVYTINNAYTDSLVRVQTETLPTTAWKMYEGRSAGGAVKYYVDGTGGAYFAGNVGIGAAPSFPFSVTNGTSGGTVSRILHSGSAASPGQALQVSNGYPIAGSNYEVFGVYGNNFGTSYLTVKDDGKVGIMDSTPSYALDVTGGVNASGGYTTVSDIRTKEDIHSLQSMLDKILRLNGVSYYWKNRSADPAKQIGFIAQEVEKEFPELVKTDDEGFKALNYSQMVSPVVQAIKEFYAKWTADSADLHAADIKQSREISSLKEENKKLREELDLIKKKIGLK